MRLLIPPILDKSAEVLVILELYLNILICTSNIIYKQTMILFSWVEIVLMSEPACSKN